MIHSIGKKTLYIIIGLIFSLTIGDRIFAYDSAAVVVSSQRVKKLILKAKTKEEGIANIRSAIITLLVKDGFHKFKKTPQTPGQKNILTLSADNNYNLTPLDKKDKLDKWIEKALSGAITVLSGQDMEVSLDHDLILTPEDQMNLGSIYLFKNMHDLSSLGYTIVSQRTRVNKDAGYRRDNIKKAFGFLGNIIVLNPGDRINFTKDIQFDENTKTNYNTGKIIFKDEEIEGYGGGICGASTALYQGILTNKGLKVVQQKAHSKRWSNLYGATINGQYIDTPGLDSTIYNHAIDLVVENIRPYPIIIVANYDGTYNTKEEIFTLSKEVDQGSLYFVSQNTTKKITKKNQKTKTGCYIRNINGKEKKSCYNEIY